MKKALISVGILLSIVTQQLRLRLRPKRAVLVYWCNVVWWNRAIQQWQPYGEYQSCGSRQRPLQYMILQAIINNRGDLTILGAATAGGPINNLSTGVSEPSAL